jgi:hypothetical protein
MDERDSHKVIEILNAGVQMERMTLTVALEGEFSSFETSFKYACSTCIRTDEAQTITAMIRR